VLNNYSYYLSERGERLDVAKTMSEKSLHLRPDETTFLDTYGWILYKKGEYSKAKDAVQTAVNKGDKKADGTIFDHLGNIYYKLNDKEKAVYYWKIAKERGSDDPLLDKKIGEGKLYE
jgi:Tfp pilus assembly protein PilF